MFLNIDLGCECQTLILSLKNDVLFRYPQAQGIYQRSGKIVGKPTWISEKTNKAIWYTAPGMDWAIGDIGTIGTTYSKIAGFGDQGKLSCPYNTPNDTWKYSNNGRGWVVAGVNDVNIQCLTGESTFVISSNFNINFQSFLYLLCFN